MNPEKSHIMKKLLFLSFIFLFSSINIFAISGPDEKESTINKTKNQKNLLPPSNFVVQENALATWKEPMVFISENNGEATNCYYEILGHAYGVVFDLSTYPDAMAHSLEFHHTSMGLSGFWDYNLHIVNWDTQEFIASYGSFATKGDDIWETNISLDSIDLQGASMVAFLMEPLGNDSTDAYPDLSADNQDDSQGSVFGPLNDLASFESSLIGNFLMNVYIMTSSGKKTMAPRALNLPCSSSAKKKLGTNAVESPSEINQTKESQNLFGYHIYLDGEFISFTESLSWQYLGLTIGENYTAGISAVYENGESEIIGYEFTANDITSIPLIASSQDLGLQIKPNPSDGPITLVSLNNANIQEIQIINLAGRVVQTLKGNNELKQSIDLSNYSLGAYIIKVKTLDEVITSRVILK